MALRTGHGAGAGAPRIETLPIDELPAGAAAPEPLGQAAVARDARGRLAGSEAARALGRRGGQQSAGTTRLAHSLGLAAAVSDGSFTHYRRAAENFKRAQVQHLARTVGGGHCGPGPSSMVASAALQLAASRWAFDRGDFDLGSKLANDSSQNLAKAHEYCAKEAKARPQQSAKAALEARLSQGGRS